MMDKPWCSGRVGWKGTLGGGRNSPRGRSAHYMREEGGDEHRNKETKVEHERERQGDIAKVRQDARVQVYGV